MRIKYQANNDPLKWNFYTSGKKLKYVTRDEAISRFWESKKSNENNTFVQNLKKNRKVQIENEGIVKIDFADSSFSHPTKNELEQEFKELENQDKKMHIWDGYLSVSNETANYFKFGSQKDFSLVIKRYMQSFLKAEGINPKNVSFYLFIHLNTNNPHAHFMFYEKEPEFIDEKINDLSFRKKGKFNISNIKKFEWLASNYLLNKSENDYIYNIKNSFWSNKNNFKKLIKNYYFDTINQKMIDVANEIFTKKIKVYKHLSSESKKNVNDYFEEQIIQMPIELQSMYFEYKYKISEGLKSDSSFLDYQKEKEDFETWIGNKIVRDIQNQKWNEINKKVLLNKAKLMQNKTNLLNQLISDDVKKNKEIEKYWTRKEREKKKRELEKELRNINFKKKIESLRKYSQINKK